MSIHSNRKNQHVSLAEKFYERETLSPFADLHFVHHSLPEMAVADVDLSTQIAELDLKFPFYINAMTGGSDWTAKINKQLAKVAHETSIPMATGSISVAMKDAETADSFKIVRKMNPDGIVMANLGAGHGLENAKKAVDLLEADAFQIHINSPQEIVMPEGDRDFSMWLENIEAIVTGLDIPVIVKEVGFGMSTETIRLLQSAGVQNIDISGSGGTNFSQIENFRRDSLKYDDLEGWGQTTPVSLLEAQPFINDMSILSSGGIRQPLDIVKSLALGAKAAGMSSQILHKVIDGGVDSAVQYIEEMKEEIQGIYTLLGVKSTAELQQTDIIIAGQTKDWCEARKIDYRAFAKRSNK